MIHFINKQYIFIYNNYIMQKFGFNQKRFNSTSFILSHSIYLGTTRGKGSTTRMYNYHKQKSSEPFFNVRANSMTNLPTPTPIPRNTFLYSKNTLVANNFTIGETINKDMENENYTNEFDPQNFYPQFFPEMEPLIDENIVAGDKSNNDRLIASYWNDFGNDVFDDWGYFYIYDVETGKYYFPLFSYQNNDDGIINTQICNAFGRTFTIKHGYPVKGIFKFDISVNDNKPFRFGSYGNMGSDGDHVITDLIHPYSKSSINLQLFYVKQQENDNDREILYSYFIPKKISQNNTQTYNLYQYDDDNSLISKEVTNGLIVYFSKTNDVKEWIVNDIDIL